MKSAFDAPAGREKLLSECNAAALTPTALENLIEVYRTLGTLEPDRARRKDAFDRMRELIAKRTSGTVARMEAERGLRAP